MEDATRRDIRSNPMHIPYNLRSGIFMKKLLGVCNISLVSIRILPVDRARGLMSWKVSVMENVYYVMSA
jgi:hypothetical protein